MRRILLLIGLLFLFIKPIYAAQSSITEAEGNACMGDDKSRKQTEQVAIIDAKKKAIELVSTYIKSESIVKNFELEKDLISAYTNAEVKIIQELEKTWYKDTSFGDCFKIKIKAEVTPNAKSKESEYSDYNLQERCGQQAEQAVKDKHNRWGLFEKIKNNHLKEYENHFNKKLNKCLLLLRHIDLQASSDKDEWIYDLNENKEIGSCMFLPNGLTSCFINGELIKEMKREDWNSFVSKIMQE